MYSLHCNVKITRRKTLNFLTNDKEETVFSSHRVMDCFRYLLDNEIYTFILCDEDERVRVMIGNIID